jgi:hypothetical protein
MYVAGRRLFMAPDMLWDGSQVRSLMGAGESLTIAGTAYQLKRTEVLDVAADGRALVYWDSDRPPANGWGWHDGTTLQAWLKEGDALPGEKDVTIKNLSTGNGCYTHCVPMPRTGPDGTVAAVLEVAGASYKKALYRIGPVRTVKILDDTERVSGSIRGTNDKLNLGDGKIDLGDVEVRAVSNNAVFFRQVYREKPGFSLVRGPWEVYFLAQPAQIWTSPTEVRERALLGEWYRFDDKGAVFPDGDSDRLLFSVWTLKMGRGFKASLVFFPGLYEWNANGAANAIQWEQAMGADAAMVKETLQRRGTQASTTRGGPSIELSPATAMPGAVRVRLPALGNAPRNWLIVPAAGPAKLERKPALTVKGADVSAADVVAWLGTNEALVELNDGLHVLTRTTR